MKKIAILGASGHGKVIADIAEQCGWQDIVFFDDVWPQVRENGVWPVIGDTETLLKQFSDYDGVIIGIGNNLIRFEKIQRLKSVEAPLVSLIHPAAVVSDYTIIGVGSVVMAGVVVNINATMGCGTILNTGCTVDHDCLLADSVHISPGAHLAGNVSIGEKSWIGIGACVRQGVTIGSNVMVGAGAAVVNDLPDDVTALGVPARVKL